MKLRAPTAEGRRNVEVSEESKSPREGGSHLI